MSRTAAALLCVLACASAADAGPPIRLDRAGLAALARENPAHYERVQQILRTRSQVGDERLPGCAGVSFDARELDVSAVLLTTAPPQRDVRFVLDDVPYVIRVAPRVGPARVTETEGVLEPEGPCPRR